MTWYMMEVFTDVDPQKVVERFKVLCEFRQINSHYSNQNQFWERGRNMSV